MQTLTLQEALQAATQNSSAQIAQQQLQSTRAEIAIANHAPLPTLSSSVSQIDLEHGVGAGSWLGDKRVDKNIGIDWTWERGNKRALRTLSATQAATAAAHDLSEALIQQKLLASRAFFDLFAAQQRVYHMNALAASTQQLAGIASRRLAAGDLSAQDAARSTIEAQRAQNEAVLAQQERSRAQQALYLLVGIGPGAQQLFAAHVVPSSNSDSSAPAANVPASRTAIAQAQALLMQRLTPPLLPPLIEQRADVQSALARLESAKAAFDQALALKKSDVTLGTAIDHFPGTSTRQLTFRMQMPLQLDAIGGYGFEGEIARAKAQLAIAQTTWERTGQAALSDSQRLAQDLLSSEQRAANYRQGIVPAAQRVATQAEIAYAKGALSLTDLLDARRIWRAATLEAISARTDFEKALAAWTIRMEAVK